MVMPSSMRIHSSASWDRFEKLIGARCQPGAHKSEIDDRIWELFGETWVIMFTDLSGFSRRVEEFGVIHFLQTIYESNRILVPYIDDYNGILLKIEGDSLMVLFKNPDSALECAIAMQGALREYNRDQKPEEQVLLCVGLGFGSVLKIGDQDVFGAEVNAASKLGEDTAKAWEILITDEFRLHLNREQLPFEELNFEALNYVPPGAKAAWRVLYPGFQLT